MVEQELGYIAVGLRPLAVAVEELDEDVANALTYVYNSWENSGGEVTPSEVKAQRSSIRTSSAGAHE